MYLSEHLVYFVLVCLDYREREKRMIICLIGVSLVSNTLLQYAIVELEVIDLFIRIMESTEYIDVKVKKIEIK